MVRAPPDVGGEALPRPSQRGNASRPGAQTAGLPDSPQAISLMTASASVTIVTCSGVVCLLEAHCRALGRGVHPTSEASCCTMWVLMTVSGSRGFQSRPVREHGEPWQALAQPSLPHPTPPVVALR